jgi:hypothetical protein
MWLNESNFRVGPEKAGLICTLKATQPSCHRASDVGPNIILSNRVR